MKKTIVGSTLKAIKKAKVYGTLNIKDISLLKVINKLKNNSGLELDAGIIFKLDKISRDIINSNDELCNYRQDNAYTEVSNNLFLTNSVNGNELYSLWLSRGNTGTLNEFLDLLLKDEDLKAELTNW